MGATSKNFSESELACSCCGKNEMTQETVDALQGLRESLGRPLKLSSAYRCPKHNSKVVPQESQGHILPGWRLI